LQNDLQIDLLLHETPLLNLTEDERAQLIAALATMLLSAIRVAADE
jgi:hypothetical protein